MRSIEFWLMLLSSCSALGGVLALYFILPDYWYREEWWMRDDLRRSLRHSAKQTRAVLAILLFAVMGAVVWSWTSWLG